MGITAINGVTITASLATSASTFAVTDTTTGVGPYYPVFVDGTTGTRTPRVDSSTLTYNATTNQLTTTSSFATSASQAISASHAIIASSSIITNAIQVGASTTATAQQYILFAINNLFDTQ